MNSTNQTIRKAAILVSSLDTSTADALLAQMSSDEAAAVRRAVMDLGHIAAHEQEQVIGEFVRGQTVAPVQEPAGIKLDDSLARRLAMPTHPVAADGVASAPPRAQPVGEPFQFLHEIDKGHLAAHLRGEHPQTIAVVLSHLPPPRAADVVGSLPDKLQSDVLGRLADLDQADEDIVREVEQGLMARLDGQSPARPAASGLSAVAKILRAIPSRHARTMLDNIQRHNQRLGRHLSRRRHSFADLQALEEETLRVVFGAASPELTKLALVGADTSFSDRILALLPAAKAESVSRGMQLLGPTPLSDLEDAQQEIAELAHDLEAEGLVDLPHTVQCV